MAAKLFNWPPLRLIAVDADTHQPLSPNIRKKTYVKFYEVKKDNDGRSSIVAHKRKTKEDDVTSQDVMKTNGPNAKGEKARKAAGNEVKQNDGADAGKDRTGKEWTAGEDARLKAMKKDNKTWKYISVEIGRPQNELKKRFKEVKHDDDASIGADKENSKDTEDAPAGKGNRKKGSQDVHDNKAEQPNWANMTLAERKAEGLRRNAEKAGNKQRDQNKRKDDMNMGQEVEGNGGGKKPTKQHKSVKGVPKNDPEKAASKIASMQSLHGSEEVRFTMREWLALQEDDLFSFGELKCLSEIIMRNDIQTWLRVAARFFDMTGRRVHPDDIREKFEEMARMSS